MKVLRFKKHVDLLTRGVVLLMFVGITTYKAKAQNNLFSSSYFQNQYALNPAMGGLDSSLKINLGYQKQWSAIQGAPKTQLVTADYGVGKKVGIGINISNDVAGLLKRTRVTGSYAYHLPVGETQRLNFGISLGIMNQRLETESVNGDQDDVNIGSFNQRKTYFDGDFGIAYTTEDLTVQAVIPNLKTFLNKDDFNAIDRTTFFSAASYKLSFDESLKGIILEPKVCFRGVKGLNSIVDLGSNVTFLNNALNFMLMYHTSQSATFGVGVNYKKLCTIQGVYTTETAALRGYINGNFEINLKLNLF